MASSVAPVTYERVYSDLTVLASLTSIQGKEQKLIYTPEGLRTEPEGWDRAARGTLNWLASYVRLDSGISRDISDLTPIMDNILTFCSSDEIRSIDEANLKKLDGIIPLAFDGLFVLFRKYFDQSKKQDIISLAKSKLLISNTFVQAQKEKLKKEGKKADAGIDLSTQGSELDNSSPPV